MISEVSGLGVYVRFPYGKHVRSERAERIPGKDSIEAPVAINTQTPGTANTINYSAQESADLEELKRRDRELRHDAVVHGTSLLYKTGPDGHIYVTGRKVSLDASEVPNDPEATIDKAQEIRRAVNSQEDRSLEDLHKFFAASRMEAGARAKLMRKPKEINGEYIRYVDKYV